MPEAKLLISAYTPDQFPKDDRNELVFVGKSNIGKSSVINALLDRKNLAFVGKTPGKTRCVNYYDVANRYRFVDVPGYGFAKRSYQEALDYDALMDAYFTRNHIVGVVLMLDGKLGLTKDDIDMIEFLRFHRFNIIAVLNKIDKANQSQQAKAFASLANAGLTRDHVILVSCTSGKGIDRLKTTLTVEFELDPPLTVSTL